MIATVDTQRMARARTRRGSSQSEISAPPQPSATGEIASAPTPAPGPQSTAQPSILVDDLAAAHAAVAKVASTQLAAPASADAASSSRERAVEKAREDAVEFEHHEEEFFRAGTAKTGKTQQHTKVESFEDLDEGYEPIGFWDRVLGRKRRSSSTGLPVAGPAAKDPKAPPK